MAEGRLTTESWDDKQTGQRRSKQIFMAFKVTPLTDVWYAFDEFLHWSLYLLFKVSK
jgi:hypothetical protein